MLYQIQDGTVSVGGRTILSHIHFEIKGSEKLALVGRNGAGKTTLLRLIAGEIDLDRDDHRQQPGIVTSRKIEVRMLRQTNEAELERTVEELLLEGCCTMEPWSEERYAYELEYDRLFTGIGFEKGKKRQKLSSFSGGERTKILLIRELLAKPDILLLDEPTNHLDLAAVEWLEGELRRYERAVVVVSHDRFFLDRVVHGVYELQEGGLVRYSGNYTDYRNERRRAYELQRKAYERQQAEIARQEDLIKRFKNKPKKAAFARSRKSMLDRMERLPKPVEEDSHHFHAAIVPKRVSSKWVIRAKELKIGYGDVLAELSLRVRKGQKIGIIGSNGAGKSTFLKTLAGLIPPLSGKCELGERVDTGYFDQNSAESRSGKTVIEHFEAVFPSKTPKEIRQELGAWLFRGPEAAKRVCDLSGGERARLILAELLISGPNLLLLDEPTNHMDIPACETLESAFAAYTGTLLIVSHDRYLIRQIADALLIFDDGEMLYYPFGYNHYLERREKLQGRPGELAAILRAEEQELVEGLRAVPEAERHRLREIRTETAYRDWRMRLVTEPLTEAEEQVRMLEGELAKESERFWTESGSRTVEREKVEEEYLKYSGQFLSETVQNWLGTKEGMSECRQQYEEAVKDWTVKCLAWYEEYLNM